MKKENINKSIKKQETQCSVKEAKEPGFSVTSVTSVANNFSCFNVKKENKP